MKPHLLLVGFGPHAQSKHMPLINDAIRSGDISGFTILDLKSKEAQIRSIAETIPFRPTEIILVPDERSLGHYYSNHSDIALANLQKRHPKLKAIISTEPKAHVGYLRALLTAGIDCLVDKPAVLPMDSQGRVESGRVVADLEDLINRAQASGAKCSVMTPRRYNHLYRSVVAYAQKVARQLCCPVTHVGIRHHGGVWNTPQEFLSREDHPYKYGYGMLCHSGYHYVDILSSVLRINEEICGDLGLEAKTASISAADHIATLGMAAYDKLKGSPAVNQRRSHDQVLAYDNWGEVDLSTVITASDTTTNRRVTLCSMDLIQSSTSLRGWAELPENVYNRNGRFSQEEIRINVGPFVSIQANILKSPSSIDGTNIRFEKTANIDIWRNASIFGQRAHSHRRIDSAQSDSYKIDFDSDRRTLFKQWVLGQETRSTLASHMATTKLFQLLLQSLEETEPMHVPVRGQFHSQENNIHQPTCGVT